MATIRSAIQVTDGMSPAFKSMNNAMNIVINSFEALQDASGNAIDNSSIKTAREELAKAQYAFDNVEREIRESDEAQRKFNNQIKQGHHMADGLNSRFKRMAATVLGVAGIRKGISSVNEWLGLSDIQTRAETQLQTVMGSRMGTVDIQAVLDITSAQQQIGVLGDEIQLMGAQQVATFLNSEDALHALIPAMNNLAAQQNGVNATGQDMVNIGNMMGKVMQGQVGALSRVGITFTEAQEQVLKYGTEIERANMLSEIITANVGNMNEALTSTPEGQIQQIKNEFGDIKEVLGSHLYPTILKVFDSLKSNIPMVEKGMMGFANVVILLVNIFDNLLGVISWIYNIFENNWSTIEPIIWGLVGAFTAYSVVTAIQTNLTWASVTAHKALITTLLSNPIFWVAMSVGVLISLLYRWVKSVGGVRVAWLIAMNSIMTSWDWVQIGFFTGVYWILDLFDKLNLGMMSASVAIQNHMGDMRSGTLNILQSMVNGSVDIINGFINKLNKLPGVSIDTIGSVSFGTIASLENEANKRARESELNDFRNEIESNISNRESKLSSMKNDALLAQVNRQAEIESAKQFEKLAKDNNIFGDFGAFGMDDVVGDMSDIASNTAKMANSMEASEEELKYLREIAEAEAINRFTTAEIKVDLGGVVNNVSKDTDLDGMITYLEEKLYETMIIAAEGVHG